jgi:hypothetical protein
VVESAWFASADALNLNPSPTKNKIKKREGDVTRDSWIVCKNFQFSCGLKCTIHILGTQENKLKSSYLVLRLQFFEILGVLDFYRIQVGYLVNLQSHNFHFYVHEIIWCN